MAKTKSKPATVMAAPKKAGDGGRIEKAGAKIEKTKVVAKAVVAAGKPPKTAVTAEKKEVLKNGDKKVCLRGDYCLWVEEACASEGRVRVRGVRIHLRIRV
jgi:hypothetical protein